MPNGLDKSHLIPNTKGIVNPAYEDSKDDSPDIVPSKFMNGDSRFTNGFIDLIPNTLQGDWFFGCSWFHDFNFLYSVNIETRIKLQRESHAESSNQER